jgi:hypothetical protein
MDDVMVYISVGPCASRAETSAKKRAEIREHWGALMHLVTNLDKNGEPEHVQAKQ